MHRVQQGSEARHIKTASECLLSNLHKGSVRRISKVERASCQHCLTGQTVGRSPSGTEMRGLYSLGCRLVKEKETITSHRGTVEGEWAMVPTWVGFSVVPLVGGKREPVLAILGLCEDL